MLTPCFGFMQAARHSAAAVVISTFFSLKQFPTAKLHDLFRFFSNCSPTWRMQLVYSTRFLQIYSVGVSSTKRSPGLHCDNAASELTPDANRSVLAAIAIWWRAKCFIGCSSTPAGPFGPYRRHTGAARATNIHDLLQWPLSVHIGQPGRWAEQRLATHCGVSNWGYYPNPASSSKL